MKFNQEAWLNPNIDINTDLKKVKKKWFKVSSSWFNIAVFGNIMENVRKHRDSRLVTTKEMKRIRDIHE